MKDREIVALASAWRGHLQFEQSSYSAAASSLRQAFENASGDDHSTRSRCAIVLFNVFALCGDTKEGQRWFLYGREHALSLGDQAGIDALLHSRATFGLARLRVQRCTHDISESALATVRSDVSSARNLQRLAGIEAHSAYIDLCNARLHILENKFESAINMLLAARDVGPFPRGHLNQNLVELEIAFCNARLGRFDLAVSGLSKLVENSIEVLDIDDHLIASWMNCELRRMSPQFGSLGEAEHEFNQTLNKYEEHLQSIKREFRQFVDMS